MMPRYSLVSIVVTFAITTVLFVHFEELPLLSFIGSRLIVTATKLPYQQHATRRQQANEKHENLPHILLIVTDQFRYDALSSDITPNLYRFLLNYGKKRNKKKRNGNEKRNDEEENNDDHHHDHAILFQQAYSSTPTCTPARAGILTGKSPWSHGLLGYASATNCNQYPTTLPKTLKTYFNYTTSSIGKNHFGKTNRQGYDDYYHVYDGLKSYYDDYDVWFASIFGNGTDPLATCDLQFNDWPACPYVYDEYAHPTSWTTRTALKYLQDYFLDENMDDDDGGNKNKSDNQQKKGKKNTSPLLLKVSYHRPHSPYDPPSRFFNKYLPGGTKSNISQLERLIRENCTIPGGTSSNTNTTCWDDIYHHYIPNMNETRNAWAGDPGYCAAKHSRAGYYANVEFVDEGIGQLLTWLGRTNSTCSSSTKMSSSSSSSSSSLIDDFLIIWISDHGDMNGDHYLWRKGYPYQSSSHVPMIIKLPKNNGNDKNEKIILSSSSSSFISMTQKREEKQLQEEEEEHDKREQSDPNVDGVSKRILHNQQQSNDKKNYEQTKKDGHNNNDDNDNNTKNNRDKTMKIRTKYNHHGNHDDDDDNDIWKSNALVENRDIVPTIYDYLGILEQVKSIDPLMNGRSLLPILLQRQQKPNQDDTLPRQQQERRRHHHLSFKNDNTSSRKNVDNRNSFDTMTINGEVHVRQWLDLEHGNVYTNWSQWNALIGYDDGREYDGNDRNENNRNDHNHDSETLLLYKYIYHAYNGTEQLFCLTTDPNEFYDLSTFEGNCYYQNLIKKWRRRLIQQFIDEGRNEHWIEINTYKNNDNNNDTNDDNGTEKQIVVEKSINNVVSIDNAIVKLRQRNTSILYGPNFPCHA